MFKNNIRLLIAGCGLIVGVFGVLQYFLIMKTYQLEKEKYVSELRQAIAQNLREEVEKIHATAVASVIDVTKHNPAVSKDLSKTISTQIARDNKMLRTLLLEAIGRVPELNGVNYNLSYPRILLRNGNKADTLVSASTHPLLVIAGSQIKEPNRLSISNGVQSTTFKSKNAKGKLTEFTVEISIAQNVNIDAWRSQALKRLAAVYLSCAGLIILIVLVLYGIVVALLKQKKVAELKTDFANNITHELKTPLSTAGIIIKTLSILDAAKDKQLFQEQLLSLEKQHQKITRTVDFVLESAMVNTPPVMAEEFNVKGWLLDLINNRAAPLHQLLIECDPDERINNNQVLLTGILGNLLDNAIKYSDLGGTITIRYYTNNDDYIFEVEDNGLTIPQKYRPYLFDKFYRIPEDNNKHSVKGLGLGLYLCRRNASALGGHLSYLIPHKVGNCFQLNLPKHEA
ncbi:hypothetical protein A0256_07640 [Mucilaginibacter sp. PAMC 26640]|nr:hypothetical protein A0256_07640 [Mucilaginibacter sp. PAMC 26640]